MHTYVPLLRCLALTASLGAGTALAGPGEDTVNALNGRLANLAWDCGAPSQPAFLCSGAVIRATDTPKFWVPQQKNIDAGGISASYLRNDAKFKVLVYHRNSGFTLYPVFARPSNSRQYQVLCSFPNDAGTDNRLDRGCGDHVQNPTVQTYCDQMDIRTAQAWIRSFPADKVKYSEICAFDVRDEQNGGTAQAFRASLEARNLGGQTLFELQNELRIATWGNNPPYDPPVESVFYTTPPSSAASGLENARGYQIEWWLATKKFVTLAKLNLPQTLSANPKFSYDPADQAIQPVTSPDTCATYFDSARFVDLPGAPGRKSLVVTPSACGREVREEQTNNFFNHLVARYYRDPAWQGSSAINTQNILSMRRQLVCHFIYRRYAPEWTLEPHRELIDIQAAGAKQCDN